MFWDLVVCPYVMQLREQVCLHRRFEDLRNSVEGMVPAALVTAGLGVLSTQRMSTGDLGSCLTSVRCFSPSDLVARCQ
jgi:hypothetical protein